RGVEQPEAHPVVPVTLEDLECGPGPPLVLEDRAPVLSLLQERHVPPNGVVGPAGQLPGIRQDDDQHAQAGRSHRLSPARLEAWSVKTGTGGRVFRTDHGPRLNRPVAARPRDDLITSAAGRTTRSDLHRSG